jgi:hypothetical protein
MIAAFASFDSVLLRLSINKVMKCVRSVIFFD